MFTALIFLFYTFLAAAARSIPISTCRPSHTLFGVASASSSSNFIPITPPNSYAYTSSGLELFLLKPDAAVKTLPDGTNDRTSDGSTFNSTFHLLYGRVIIELAAVRVPGAITAGILIADGPRDEIDVEILGSAANEFQTNIFVPAPQDNEPLYGVFSSVENVPGHVGETHSYSIDWTPNEITWGIDGKEVRKITRQETFKNNAFHFPSHPARVQLGVWDASTPVGTAEWAGGPIDWNNKRARNMKALVKSVKVECPF